MKGQERRIQILELLRASSAPLSGVCLAKQLQVSRQVIVQDIALLRANGTEILSTNQGYLLPEPSLTSRVFKVVHTDEQVEEELSLIVDCGGWIEDVFVYHKVYGIIKAPLNIHSRLDIKNFMQDIISGKSKLLKNVTSGYHYHTVQAESEQVLNYIQQQLQQKGFLAELQDYEPIDFHKQTGK